MSEHVKSSQHFFTLVILCNLCLKGCYMQTTIIICYRYFFVVVWQSYFFYPVLTNGTYAGGNTFVRMLSSYQGLILKTLFFPISVSSLLRPLLYHLDYCSECHPSGLIKESQVSQIGPGV
jgi:hypothetical protein